MNLHLGTMLAMRDFDLRKFNGEEWGTVSSLDDLQQWLYDFQTYVRPQRHSIPAGFQPPALQQDGDTKNPEIWDALILLASGRCKLSACNGAAGTPMVLAAYQDEQGEIQLALIPKHKLTSA